MPETAEPYDVTVTGEVYQVGRAEDEGAMRICIYNRGALRYSLPIDTSQEQARKFIQVYALGFTDGQSARSAAVEGHIRGRLNLAARRLGEAVGKLRANT